MIVVVVVIIIIIIIIISFDILKNLGPLRSDDVAVFCYSKWTVCHTVCDTIVSRN